MTQQLVDRPAYLQPDLCRALDAVRIGDTSMVDHEAYLSIFPSV